jgi:cytochrome c2
MEHGEQEVHMKKDKLSLFPKKVIVLIVVALLSVIVLTVVSSETKKPAGDAAAGVEYMTKSCMMCHCVPDPGTIKPFNEETGRAFLADHMIQSSEEDLDNMIAYFFPAVEEEPVVKVVKGDAAAGVEYMTKSCMMCHCVPDPSTIKPFNEETGRAFLADHMIQSSEEDLDNMIAYFFPAE